MARWDPGWVTAAPPQRSLSAPPGQVRSLCYNNCSFSLALLGRTLHYDFSALATSTAFASGPSFTSKGLKYFHHFNISLCGNRVSAALEACGRGHGAGGTRGRVATWVCGVVQMCVGSCVHRVCAQLYKHTRKATCTAVQTQA